MSSNGFDKILNEFQSECWESMSRITESYAWHEIVVAGKPAEVSAKRNTYRGYLLGGYFYYMGHDREVKFIKADDLGDKLKIITQRPKQPVNASEEMDEGFISDLGIVGWDGKRKLTKAFSQKKLEAAVRAFKKVC